MGFHTFDVERADELEDAARRYRYCSAEELVFALDPAPDDVVADLGSGTGFFTDDVAPHVRRLFAVDVQEAMHDRYREKGVPDNVDLVTASIGDLSLDGGEDVLDDGEDVLDAAFSTMTYHEFAGDAALERVASLLRPGGRLVLVDWSADGAGDAGPPVDERFGLDAVVAALEGHGFDVVRAEDRPETWLVVARAASARGGMTSV